MKTQIEQDDIIWFSIIPTNVVQCLVIRSIKGKLIGCSVKNELSGYNTGTLTDYQWFLYRTMDIHRIERDGENINVY